MRQILNENLNHLFDIFLELPSLASNANINTSSINEFQMINPNEDNNSSIKDDSCLVVSRTITDKNGSFILKNTQINNCSQSRHVLCKTKPMYDFSSSIGCYSKPLTLDLPAMISNHLTYELCLSVCQSLETNSAVIHMNKCYCVNADILQILTLISNHTKFATKDCGNPCSGMFDKSILILFFSLKLVKLYFNILLLRKSLKIVYLAIFCYSSFSFQSRSILIFTASRKKRILHLLSLMLHLDFHQYYKE